MKFRSKRKIIEATQYNKPGDHPMVVECYWNGDSLRWAPGYPDYINVYMCDKKPSIKTLEGWHIVTPGDWIITGLAGEHYPCKPGIFEKSYEEIK